MRSSWICAHISFLPFLKSSLAIALVMVCGGTLTQLYNNLLRGNKNAAPVFLLQRCVVAAFITGIKIICSLSTIAIIWQLKSFFSIA